MTALAAFWSFDHEAPAPRCMRMLAAQADYGRDGARQIADEATGVALGRDLFALTAEDVLDRGPQRGEASGLMLAADVRIDNRADLASGLGIKGEALDRLPDAALMLRVVERWGHAGFGRIVGPFAAILWDARTHRLTLARDPMGERPLHYYRAMRFVAAASMAKGLHALPEIPYAADTRAAADFLALVPETGSGSFFAGISRVRPGHVVTIDAKGERSETFWTWDAPPLRPRGPDDYAEALRTAFDRAVARRLRVTGGAIGAQLSGGLDSAAVAATAARLIAPAPLHAFTAVPSGPSAAPAGTIADEGPLAAETAAFHPNIVHRRIGSGGASPLPLFDRHFRLFERPVLNPSNAVWAEAINDAAKAVGVRVLLTGQMGNLTISHAGLEALPRMLAGGRWLAFGMLARGLRRNGLRSTGIGAASLGPFLPVPFWEWLQRTMSGRGDWRRASALADAKAAAVVERAKARGLDLSYRPWRDGRAMRIWALGRIDMGVYNKGVLGGWGIDLRDPTIDRDLVALCLAIPDEAYAAGGIPRSLARRAFADRLPPAVLNERRRGFQAADWPVGLSAARSGIASELDALERCADAAATIDLDRLRADLSDWPSDGWDRPDRLERYELAMLRGLAAGHFLRRVARTN